MERERWPVLGIVIICALLSLSCITPCFAGRRAAPTAAPTVPVSQDAAKRLQDKAADLADQEFRVEFTEEEITSYLALNEANSPLRESLHLTSPQVRFLPGKIVLEGDITSPVRGHLTVEGTVTVVSGRPEVQFQDARIGMLSAPRSLLASLSDGISERIAESDTTVEIHSIEVLAGRIIVTGRSLKP